MKKILTVFIIFSIIYLLFITTENWITENKIGQDEVYPSIETVSKEQKEPIQNTISDCWYEEENGIKVIAKLEIPKINLKTNILENCDNNNLYVSVCKFWGVNPNEIGNFCVAGHNYFKRKNMFYNLKKLKVGDKIYIEDTSRQKIEYEVYKIIKVNPKDTKCLEPETNEKREITLITCTQDSKNRIIVKAREK